MVSATNQVHNSNRVWDRAHICRWAIIQRVPVIVRWLELQLPIIPHNPLPLVVGAAVFPLPNQWHPQQLQIGPKYPQLH